jgi:plasmid stabilization system protein ParE
MALRHVFLDRAITDLMWFRTYYKEHFPEGMAKANARFVKCVKLLCEHPTMGRTAGKAPRRRFAVPNTPYTIVYQNRGDLLEVVRVLDQRKETYMQELFENP